MRDWLSGLWTMQPKEEDAPMQLYGEVFSHLPVLDTPRLMLRPMRMSDAADIYAYSSDPEVARHVLWDAHKSISETKAYLRFILKQYRDGTPSSYGIVLKENARVIGSIGFMWLNTENRAVEVGYSLSRAWWNRGVMTEALQAVLSMAFRELHVYRVEAQHETDNPASGKVMLKAGMRHEGTLRGRIYHHGRFMDVDLYAIVRPEWEALHAPQKRS